MEFEKWSSVGRSGNNAEQKSFDFKKWWGVLTIAVSALVLFSSIYTIDSGNRGVVLRFGAVNRIAEPGLNFKMPFVERVKEYTVRIAKFDAHGEGASKDLQSVSTTIALNCALDGSKLDWIYKNLPEDKNVSIIQPNIQEVFKATTAKYNVDELITKREAVKSEIVSELRKRLAKYNIIVDNVSITNFHFSDQFNKAIEAKQVAEQEALTAKNQLERIKVEAEQKVASAKAEAEALRLQKQEVTPMMVELRKIEVSSKMIDKWDGKMPSTMLGNGIMPTFNTNK